MATLRTDIQALRGIAVLAVVLYHLRLVPISGGFLGVDIFFVISGYLITLLVASGVTARTFSLRDFYTRRAKRLLPAAYVTLLVTALVAPLLLSQRELRDFALQVVGTATFSANFVFWQQSGYFDGASELKPLLHTWSLAVEEQYYLLLPGLLLLLQRRKWMIAVAAAFAVSVALCVYGRAHAPEATFYLLPTRAWELLIGSIGALLVHGRDGKLPDSVDRALGWMFWPAGMATVLLLWRPLGGAHPGKSAAIVCVCTLLVILREHPSVPSWKGAKVLAWFGDLSYSLYLLHWPLVSLLRNSWVGPKGEPPWPWRAGVLFAAVLLSLIMYRLIENPVRRSRWRFTPPRVAGVIVASVLLMVISPLINYATTSSANYAALRSPNPGLGRACDYSGSFRPVQGCRTAEVARVIVWGDSFAMQLVPGLASQSEALDGVEQATRTVCGPLLGIAPLRDVEAPGMPQYDWAWALRCLEFNREVVSYIVGNPDIRIVVMSSPLVQYLPDGDWRNVVVRGARLRLEEPTLRGAVEALQRTAEVLRAAGKRVVFFAPPPSAGFDVGACLERLHTGQWTLGAFRGCAIPVPEYEQWRSRVIEMLDALEKAGLPVVRLAPFLCDARECRVQIDGIPIYSDEAHLSAEGSRLLAQRMDWARLITTSAR